MRKDEYIKMLKQDNETESGMKKSIAAEVIVGVELALKDAPADFEIDQTITAEQLYNLVADKAKKERLTCVTVVEAAPIYAEKFGWNMEAPASMPITEAPRRRRISLDDL